MPKALGQIAYDSLGRPPTSENKATGWLGLAEGLRGTLIQAEGRSGETAGNAGSLCLSRKTPQRENGLAGWQVWAAGIHEDIKASRGEKERDHRECLEPSNKVSPIPEAPRSAQNRL